MWFAKLYKRQLQNRRLLEISGAVVLAIRSKLNQPTLDKWNGVAFDKFFRIAPIRKGGHLSVVLGSVIVITIQNTTLFFCIDNHSSFYVCPEKHPNLIKRNICIESNQHVIFIDSFDNSLMILFSILPKIRLV